MKHYSSYRGAYLPLVYCILVGCIHCLLPAQIPGPIAWPTPNPAFMQGRDISAFVQPTVSGRVSSGLYGCVRNDGYRFHEGLDLFPIYRTPKGEADEPIYAIMKGIVVYRNDVGSRSSYGRYVVLEHPDADLPVYTLYAHLASVDDAIPVGTVVEAGTVIGQHGRSASYAIPKERAHLHFEIGLRVSDDFNDWYRENDYENPNYFELWNGMNLSGMDPLRFYMAIRNKSFTTFKEHIQSQPRAVTIRYFTAKTPDFAERYGSLLKRSPQEDGSVIAWDVEFSQYGMPIAMNPIFSGEIQNKKAGSIELLDIDRSLVEKTKCWKTLVKKGNGYQVGRSLERYLKLMFAY